MKVCNKGFCPVVHRSRERLKHLEVIVSEEFLDSVRIIIIENKKRKNIHFSFRREKLLRTSIIIEIIAYRMTPTENFNV
jgi:hypothetical protein